MIDTQKVINIKDKSVAESNYQLLNNLLNCNKQLSKLKRGQSNECPKCHLAENIFHLIYLCEIGRNIWQFAEIILNFDITWKLILCGFFNEINENA